MPLFDGLYLNVGAMKSGTTWLYRQLEQHPAVVFSREKELHFHARRAGDREALDLSYRLGRTRTALQRAGASPMSAAGRDVLGWYLPYLLVPPRSNRWYRRRFPQVLPEGAYCADFSNLTAVIDDAGWANIRKLAERPRISIMLRHPMGRIWSHLRFLQQLGVQHAAAETISRAQLDALDTRHGLWRHSQYSVIIDRLSKHFDFSQVKIFFYDDVTSRPLELLREFNQMRMAVEPEAAALAAQRDDLDRSEMLQALARMQSAIDGTDDALESDIAFHVAILEASDNRFFSQLKVLTQTALRFSIRLTNRQKGVDVADYEEHKAVFDAITDGEPELASERVKTMLLEVDELISSAMVKA